MANSDAQFVFETNLPQVRQEIESELTRISGALSQVHGGSGDLLGGVSANLSKDVQAAIRQIRQIQEEAARQASAGKGLTGGTATAAVKMNDVVAALQSKAEQRLRQAALKAPAEAANVDLRAVFRQLDDAVFKRLRDQSRAAVRQIERAGNPQAVAVYGTPQQIKTGRAQTDLTTVADLKQSVQATTSQRRAQASVDEQAAAQSQAAQETRQDNTQRRARRQKLAAAETAEITAAEESARATKAAQKQPRQGKATAIPADPTPQGTPQPAAELTSNERQLVEAERELVTAAQAAEGAMGSQRETLMAKALAAMELVARLRELVAAERELTAAAGPAAKALERQSAAGAPAAAGTGTRSRASGETDAAASTQAAQETTQDTTARRSRRKKQADADDAQTAATEEAAKATKEQTAAAKKTPNAERIDLNRTEQDETQRILQGIRSGDPRFGYATRTGEPGARAVPIVDRTDPNNLRFFNEKNGGKSFEEIPTDTPRYERLKRQEEERVAREGLAAVEAEAQRLAAIHANTERVLGRMEVQDPAAGFIGGQRRYAFEGLDPDTNRIYKNTGTDGEPKFEELARGSEEFAQQQAQLTPILEQLRVVLGERVEAERLAAERDLQVAAEEALLREALSQRIRNSLLNGDGEFQFLSRGNTPSREVYNTNSNETFRENEHGGYDAISEADRDYVRVQNRLADVVGHRAATEQQEDEQVKAANRAYVESLDLKARIAARDPSVQYLTDSGRPNPRLAVGPDGSLPNDPKTARYFQRSGDSFEELKPGTRAYIEAERLLTEQVRDRTTNEQRAKEASQRYAESLRRSSAGAGGGGGFGGGGFGGGLTKGLFSGGFGDNGDNPAFGLGRALGQTVKYSALYKIFNDLLTISAQVGQEFLNVDDSVVELQYAMSDTSDVTTDFINRLQDIAAPGGFNVGDAMDQAAAAVRAYRDEINSATDATGQLLDKAGKQQLEEDIGASFTKAAAQIAVIAKTTLADAEQNTRATALGFDLNPNTAAPRIADAISNAKQSGGGIEKDISQGGASIAEIAHTAGFSLEEALNVVSKLSAKLDESGQLAATRFSRMIGTLQGSAGKNFLTQLNQSLPQEQQININAKPREQILQIAAAYQSLNEAQKQQLATAIGGQAQQREFNVLVSSFPQLAKDAANSQVGLADKEYQDRLNNVRGLLGQIRGDLRGIVTNLATSGVLAPFGALLKILEPILHAVRDITAGFDKIPSTIRDIGGALLAVYGTMRLINGLRNAGGGSIVAGVKAKLEGAERVVLPGQARARQDLADHDLDQIPLTGKHDVDFQTRVVGPAAEARDVRLGEIKQQELGGDLTMGAASKARIQAEMDYRAAIRANTDQYKRDAKAGSDAVHEGGNQVRDSFRRLRGDELGNNLRDLRNAVRLGGPTIGEAWSGAGRAIKSGASGITDAMKDATAPIRDLPRVYRDLRTPQTIYRPTLAREGQEGGGSGGVLQIQASRLSAAADAIRNAASRLGSLRGDASGAGATSLGDKVADAARAAADKINSSRLGVGVEAAGERVSRGVGGLVRGAGAAVASELGPIGIAMIAADLGLQLKSAFDQIGDADRALAAAASIDVNSGAQALSDAAKANEEAAKQMREASSGFWGSIANYLQGGAPSAAADRAAQLGAEQQSLADRLQATQQTASTQTGTAALASQINTSSGDDVKTSVQNLLDAGQSAGDVLDAITLALKSLKFAATGTVGGLTELQKTDLAGRLGIAAGGAAGDRITDLHNQIDAAHKTALNTLDPKERAAAAQREKDLTAQLYAFSPGSEFGNDSGGSAFVNNRVSDITKRFFDNNPTANLTNPKDNKRLHQTIEQELQNRYGVDAKTAADAAKAAIAVLPQERDKQLTQLASPDVAAQLVQAGIANSSVEADRVAQDSKLQSLRTGRPDRSASAGLTKQNSRLQDLKATVQGDIDAIEEAIAKGDKTKDSTAMRLQLAVVENALVENEVKQAQQIIADAKADIDEQEKRRKVRQAAATSAAQVKAIGDAAIASELAKALKTMDPDLLASVIERATNDELDTFQKILEQKIATDNAAIENEKRLEEAAGILNADGSAKPNRPSPLAPGTPTPLDPGDILRGGDGTHGTGKNAAPPTPKLKGLEGQQKTDQGKLDQFKKIRGETTPNGAAATGSDVPGGTFDERQASAAAAAAERNRDSTAAAAAKVQAAQAAMEKITDHSTQEYHQAEEQYYAALNAQADLQQDTATAQAKAALYPGDKVGAAKVALDEATNAVGRFAKGSKEYWDAVGRQVQAQVDYATAQREQANLIAQTHIDLTDPVQVANQALADARRKKRDDVKAKADKGTLAQDDIDIANKASAADQAAFQQKLSDTQTAEQAGRISHAAYLRYLESEHNRLTERLAHMKKTDQGYRQTVDQLNEIDKDMKEASNQLTGQFNLGDIKIPSVYEVRRSLQAQASGLSANAISTTAVANTTTNNVTVNGADFARVTAWLQQIFAKTGRITTTPRKA